MTRPLWTAAAAAAACSGRLEGGDWSATGLSIDTRTLQPGDLFVALTDRRDGHDFAQAALDKGAAAALVSKPEAAAGPRLVVPDVLAALRALGVAARDRCPGYRVGVTGSVGKTSVKEALAAIFRAAGPAHWSEKSYNNHWGVPLTLARLPETAARAVFEMGMNHAGEISDLVSMVRPHVAMITKIAPAHLANLGSLEAIADAKAEIFEGLIEDGVAVIPADDDLSPRLAAAVRRSHAGFLLEFGRAPESAVRILSWDEGPDGGAGRMDVIGRIFAFRLKTTGPHQPINAAGIVAAALAAGVEPEQAFDVLATIEPAAGRGAAFDARLGPERTITVIDDSYNANPASMLAAFGSLKTRTPRGAGRRIAVLGEMLELGPRSAELHADLAEPLIEAGADLVLTVGPGAESLAEALGERAVSCSNPDVALSRLTGLCQDGDLVLIKGSNASGVHKIAATLRDGSPPGRA